MKKFYFHFISSGWVCVYEFCASKATRRVVYNKCCIVCACLCRYCCCHALCHCCSNISNSFFSCSHLILTILWKWFRVPKNLTACTNRWKLVHFPGYATNATKGIEIFYSLHEVHTRDLLSSITFDDSKNFFLLLLFIHNTSDSNNDQANEFPKLLTKTSVNQSYTFFFYSNECKKTTTQFPSFGVMARYTNAGRKLYRVFSLHDMMTS